MIRESTTAAQKTQQALLGQGQHKKELVIAPIFTSHKPVVAVKAVEEKVQIGAPIGFSLVTKAGRR